MLSKSSATTAKIHVGTLFSRWFDRKNWHPIVIQLISGWLRNWSWELQACLLQRHMAIFSHVGSHSCLLTVALWSVQVSSAGVGCGEVEVENGAACSCFHISALLWLLDSLGLFQWWLLWTGTCDSFMCSYSSNIKLQVQHQLLFSFTEAISTIMVLRLADSNLQASPQRLMVSGLSIKTVKY